MCVFLSSNKNQFPSSKDFYRAVFWTNLKPSLFTSTCLLASSFFSMLHFFAYYHHQLSISGTVSKHQQDNIYHTYWMCHTLHVHDTNTAGTLSLKHCSIALLLVKHFTWKHLSPLPLKNVFWFQLLHLDVWASLCRMIHMHFVFISICSVYLQRLEPIIAQYETYTNVIDLLL